MTAGEDRVAGELWEFDEDSIAPVLARLDEIEGANQPGEVDLYRREIVQAYNTDDRPIGPAYGYYYARDPVSDGFSLVVPASQGESVSWPDALDCGQ